jgi:uncharacterized protein
VPDSVEPNRELIARFYDAFGRRDGEAMAACYAPDATFEDPAFGKLEGADVGNMWRMLTGRAKSLRIELLEHDAGDADGTAHWRAHYEFAASGRPVINDVHARFRFHDGLIAEHVDSFSFFAWSRQALGPIALLIGWSPIGRRMVRQNARLQLRRFSSDR